MTPAPEPTMIDKLYRYASHLRNCALRTPGYDLPGCSCGFGAFVDEFDALSRPRPSLPVTYDPKTNLMTCRCGGTNANMGYLEHAAGCTVDEHGHERSLPEAQAIRQLIEWITNEDSDCASCGKMRQQHTHVSCAYNHKPDCKQFNGNAALESYATLLERGSSEDTWDATTERARIADYVKSCREDDTDRPRVQVFDVLAKQIRERYHWRPLERGTRQEPTE